MFAENLPPREVAGAFGIDDEAVEVEQDGAEVVWHAGKGGVME